MDNLKHNAVEELVDNGYSREVAEIAGEFIARMMPIEDHIRLKVIESLGVVFCTGCGKLQKVC